MAVKYNLVVKVGTYTDREGNEKAKWQNIGVVLEGSHGPYILLSRSFNPAGVPCATTDESILVSLFEPKKWKEGGEKQSSEEHDDAPIF